MSSYEYEVKVLGIDHDATAALILSKGGLAVNTSNMMLSTARTKSLANGRLEIDEWPLIPPYLEIEADSVQGVLNAAALFGYDQGGLTSETTTKICQRYGIDLAAHTDLRLQ